MRKDDIDVVFVKGKRKHEEFICEDHDKDKTPTNEKARDDGGSTPTVAASDEENSDGKDTLETVERALNGEDIGKTPLDNIK